MRHFVTFCKEAQRHKELQSSEKCDGYSRKVYERLVNGSATEVELSSALLDLSAMLHSHYDVAPVIIIDEYDTPIQQGHSEDYYDKIIRFMRNLFQEVLRTTVICHLGSSPAFCG